MRGMWTIVVSVTMPAYAGIQPASWGRGRVYLRLLAIASIVMVATSSVLAQPTETKLLASDGTADQQFGVSVDLWGDVAIVGAYGDETFGRYSGAAYIFRFDGSNWIEEAKLLAPHGASGQQFGISVAVEGELAVVGARGDSGIGPITGAVHVFRFDGLSWAVDAKLFASDGSARDMFGTDVAISGHRIVVGAQTAQGNAPYSGAAYVFGYDGSEWVEEAKLAASDGEYDDEMKAVDIEGDTVVAGAFLDDDGGSSSGSAYVFRFDGKHWLEDAKLVASDATRSAYFGQAVAVSREVIAVGAPSEESVYVFRLEGKNWVEEVKLTVSDADPVGDYFGHSVSLSAGKLLVGAPRINGNAGNSGAAYLFRFDGTSWVEEAELLASDGQPNDAFGSIGLALSGNAALVGARNHDENGEDSGAAYVFDGLIVPMEIAIDIKPASERNPINPFSRGVIPVAILGSETFDVADVDVTTLFLGPSEAEPMHKRDGHPQDVNEDGFTDLVSHYRTQETGIAFGDTEACVTGETLDGTPLEGCDFINTQPPCGNGYAAALVVPPVVWIGGRMRRRRR